MVGCPRWGRVILIIGLLLGCNGLIWGNEPALGPNYTATLPVLLYHRVVPHKTSPYDMTPAEFEAQLIYLRRQGYQTISAAQYLNWRQNPNTGTLRPVLLTFDDGHKSHYQRVLPLLQKYGYKATFFIITDQIAEVSSTKLTWDELATMAAAGMEIGSHTRSHPYLTKMNRGEEWEAYLQRLQNELAGSRLLLEAKLQRRIELLAYPFGWCNTTVEWAAVKAGYRGIFTVNPGSNRFDQNQLRLKRQLVNDQFDSAQLAEYLKSRPLEVEVISPREVVTVQELPLIRFRLAAIQLERVDLQLRNYRVELTPDRSGLYLFGGVAGLNNGYHSIAVKGRDGANNLYIGSWGFEYQQPFQIKHGF